MRSWVHVPMFAVAVLSAAGCGLVLDTDGAERDATTPSSDASSTSDTMTGRDADPRSDGSVDGAVADGGLDGAVADGGLDGGVADASAVDARVADASVGDASPPDALGGPDASRRDGGADAGSADAGACGTLGASCSGDVGCSTGQSCTNGVCIPASRPMCGGIVGATCPAEYSDCPWCSGCDFGYCLTAAERACICARAPASFDCTSP